MYTRWFGERWVGLRQARGFRRAEIAEVLLSGFEAVEKGPSEERAAELRREKERNVPGGAGGDLAVPQAASGGAPGTPRALFERRRLFDLDQLVCLSAGV